VIVSIQQPGGQAAVSVAPGQHDVLTLSFQPRVDGEFNPKALAFANTEATSASVAISFATSLALSYL
jgi:hypothetical protein